MSAGGWIAIGASLWIILGTWAWCIVRSGDTRWREGFCSECGQPTEHPDCICDDCWWDPPEVTSERTE